MIGYKGFDKNFRCRDFQYQVGETYRHDGDLDVCKSGFHFCDTPLAVLEFYPPVDENRFALVEATGKILSTDDDEHKFCTDELKILKELSLNDLLKAVSSAATNTGDYSAATNSGTCSAATNTGYLSAATNTGYRSAATNTGDDSAATNSGTYSAATNTGNRSAATNTGDYSAATNTGDYSAATNTGDYSAATNSGDRSAASVTGKHSIAIVTGVNGKAKGSRGCWLVLTERKKTGEILSVKAVMVDGVSILPNHFYSLKDGKPLIVDDN